MGSHGTFVNSMFEFMKVVLTPKRDNIFAIMKKVQLLTLIILFGSSLLFPISDEFKRLLKKKNKYRKFSGRGIIERIIPVDFNHDGKNEYVFVEKGRRRFSVFTSDGFKGWTLSNGFFIEVVRFGKKAKQDFRILLARLSEKREQMFLIYDWRGTLVKTIKLNNRLEYRQADDEFTYRPFILDINYDSVPEFVFVSNYGEELFIFDINGDQIPKKESLIYFPQTIAAYDVRENPFLPGYDFYRNRGKFYFKKNDPENSDYVVLDEKEGKSWLRIIYSGEKPHKTFSMIKLSRCDVLNNPFFYSFIISDFNGKGQKELFLGSKNRVYILNRDLSLLRVLQNVFF